MHYSSVIANQEIASFQQRRRLLKRARVGRIDGVARVLVHELTDQRPFRCGAGEYDRSFCCEIAYPLGKLHKPVHRPSPELQVLAAEMEGDNAMPRKMA